MELVVKDYYKCLYIINTKRNIKIISEWNFIINSKRCIVSISLD